MKPVPFFNPTYGFGQMEENKIEKVDQVQSGKRTSAKIKLMISSILLSILAVGFNTLFTSASLEKLYVEMNISEYRVIGQELQRKIENGIYFGKTLKNFAGIENLILREKENILNKITRKDTQNHNSEAQIHHQDISVSIVQLDGTIIHSDNLQSIGLSIPESLLSNFFGGKGNIKRLNIAEYSKYNDSYYTYHFIKNRNKESVGIVVIGLKEKQIKDFLAEMIKNNNVINISISAISIIALIIMLSLMPMDKKRFSKKKISFIIFFIICSTQILSAGLITIRFKSNFLEINKHNAETLNNIIKQNIQYLLEKGIHINKLINMEHYLDRIIQDTAELNDITLYDHNNYPLYRATKNGAIDFQKSKNAYTQWMEATKPLSNIEYNSKVELSSNDNYRGYISTNASQAIIFRKIFDIAIGSMTVLIISMLFLVEMLILFFRYLEKNVLAEKKVHFEKSIHYSHMRPAVFLLLFGVDISVSFIPLHMNELYVPFMGLTKETLIGLPISVEFMFVGIAILLSGVWLDRRGWHEPFIWGLVLASIGFIYSALAANAINFIISRAIVGLGYGLALMASQGFVITYADDNQKAQGLAHLFAGIYAGSICGGATGAMLAERFGFNITFLLGAGILLFIIGYTFIFMRHAMEKPAYLRTVLKKSPVPSEKRFMSVMQFLTNRIVISLVFFSSLPAAIAAVGFMNYFMPVYLNRLGIAQSTIGQVLMLYGICLIYVGPFISKYVDSTRDKKRYVFLGCILGSSAFLCFYLFNGIISAIVAIMMLGLSSSFVLASQSVYALKLKVTKKLGEGKAIGIFRSTSRVGQMLGPITFSWLFALADANKGMMFFGLAYLLTAILFILLTQKDYTNLVTEREDVENSK
jgi:predicted MFS family arabinose efflux permease